MSRFIRFLLSIVLAGCCSTEPPSETPQDARNVILIIADDVGAEQVPAYAAELDLGGWFNPANLPTVEMLASAGVRFKEAWSNPTCSPTRAGLLTGHYSCVHEIYDPMSVTAGTSLEDRTPLYVSLPLLLPTPYQSGYFGKWHVGDAPDNPNDAGWDNHEGAIGGELDSYVGWEKYENGSGPTTVTDHATLDVVADFQEWIALREKDGAPFLAVLAFNAAHSTKDADKWIVEDVSDDCGGTPLPSTAPIKQIYKEQIRCMDYQLGNLIDTLKTHYTSILDNTVIIFIGDNGTPEEVGEGPVASGFSKGSLYQGGVHVPMIIADGHWLLDAEDRKPLPLKPRILSPNRTTDALVHTRDLYGTILELTGNPNWDCGNVSNSLVPFLKDPTASGNPYVVTEQSADSYAIRDSQYKLIRRPSGDTFYDLTATPWESSALSLASLSIAEQSAYDALVAELSDFEDFCP